MIFTKKQGDFNGNLMGKLLCEQRNPSSLVVGSEKSPCHPRDLPEMKFQEIGGHVLFHLQLKPAFHPIVSRK